MHENPEEIPLIKYEWLLLSPAKIPLIKRENIENVCAFGAYDEKNLHCNVAAVACKNSTY